LEYFEKGKISIRNFAFPPDCNIVHQKNVEKIQNGLKSIKTSGNALLFDFVS
jgi:hypothetical protein